MTYKISIRRKAQKQLARIPASDYKKVKAAIQALANNPRPHQDLKNSRVVPDGGYGRVTTA